MGWSFKIGKLFGIPIRLHFTMAIVPFLAFSMVGGEGVLGFAVALGLTALLFGSVVAHELGHALTARRFGVHTADIVLLPIGGVARIVNLPKKPSHEIAIAVAGPLVSLAIAAAAFSLFVPSLFAPELLRLAVQSLFYTNLVLGLFNLVPALPMDGGRVLRGLLALKRDYLSATRIAVRVGRIIAIAGFVYAVYTGSWNLGFIALFVYFGAGSEERIAWMREAAERGGAAGAGFGAPGGARVYTWRWTNAPGGGSPPPQRPDRDVIVVEGGKVEVIPPKDPDRLP
jgi:stage IV sporulation protein FB